MCYFLASAIEWTASFYLILLLVRIIGSWFPSFAHHKFMRFIAFYTDPYLNLFRRLIPPIGGVLDLSPILAFLGVQAIQWVLFFFLRLVC